VVLRCYFFFQAEDGIRDDLVTGVQTCALPISSISLVKKPFPSNSCSGRSTSASPRVLMITSSAATPAFASAAFTHPACHKASLRSEERRVGKEWKSRRAAAHDTKTRDKEIDVE